MEDIAFSEWPGQAVDLSGSNHWLPAYGFQAPQTLLDKDDFLGNPDANLFFHNSQHVYLETIQEETSDDLHSESDVSDSRASPAGWLATDSESGSVIRIYAPEEVHCESDREVACPAKRRRQELVISDDDSCQSLSRSSSLLQFESLEKQCQDISSSSPSIFSTFSYDSLERKDNVSPDSLEQAQSDEGESEYFKTLKIDIPQKSRKGKSRDSLFYNCTQTDSSESADSEETLEGTRYNSSKSVNLKTWRSFDGLHGHNNNMQRTVKVSAENLSEDSGYSDNFYNAKLKSNSIPNMIVIQHEKIFPEKNIYKTRVQIGGYEDFENYNLKKSKLNCYYSGFDAYDGDIFHSFATNFGVSYHDLSIVDKYETSRSPLIDRFMRNGAAKRRVDAATASRTDAVNIDRASEFVHNSKYSTASSASEPNLLSNTTANQAVISHDSNNSQRNFKQRYFEKSVWVSSVPKDLNLAGDLNSSENSWTINFVNDTPSIAAKNWDLADINDNSFENNNKFDMPKLSRYHRAQPGDKITIRLKYDSSSLSSASDIEAANTSFKREGSYIEAMASSIDMSDEESKLSKKRNTLEFDKNLLKAISETSIQSFRKSIEEVNFTSTPTIKQNRNVISTPNLAVLDSNDSEFEIICLRSGDNIPRKSSLINRSTSTSGMSEADDKTLSPTKSFNGSTSSKGVHFSPVISEMNWRDDSVSPESESTYSLCSTPERDIKPSGSKLLNSDQRKPVRISLSQPELQKVNNSKVYADDSSDDSMEHRPYVPVAKMKKTVSQPEFVKRRMQQQSHRVDGRKSCSDLETTVLSTHSQQSQHLVNVYHQQSPTTTCHVSRSTKQAQPLADKLVTVMEPLVTHRDKASGGKSSGKFGGFFSRITSFRFSSRKNDDKKKKPYQKDEKQITATPSTGQRLATKDDYIYIPLKGPVDEKINNNQTNSVHVDGMVISNEGYVSAKPPLPKVPPRVVGACVKRQTETGAAHSAPPERRTIDSGLPRPMEPMGLIETDLDTEVTVITSGTHVKTRSLMNLGADGPTPSLTALFATPDQHNSGRPHKSMEFLLDKQNLKVVEPPENELQKGGERVMSEHQLRVQRSLQKLNVPNWYKQSSVPREGFILKKNTAQRECRWQGTGSKTTSLNSLGSNTQSPVVLSPTLHSQPFVRWSTSKLNSTASSPCASTRSSFNTRQPNGSISPSSLRHSFSYRQPYLGWRSQERLSRPRTPAERLANSILSQTPTASQPDESPEIQTSIKEVTSAIVHYVTGLRPENAKDYSYDSQETSYQRSRSVSPRGSQKLCWLESSFVGTRPLDSPQTPITLTESSPSIPLPPTSLRLDLQSHNDVTVLSSGSRKPSPSSTTLEDVLDSLLGLPSSTRAPSPSLQETASANTSPIKLQEEHSRMSEQFRRRSEGSEPSRPPSVNRRASFHSSPVLRCRYSRCGKAAVAKSSEGLAYKNCHNCSYTYCSRSCRRAHWEKHRKTCLFSRVGTLCRQVIAAAKDQEDTLHILSVIARRGYLSHGAGAVKIFFPCPEAAEKFLSKGLGCLGEPTYVRWTNLLPSEMGPQLYAELVKMCNSYNPDGKLVLYVSVCVVSEAPAAGAVKWERQLVSRCGKMRLSKSIHIPERDTENPETLILTSSPIREEPVQRFRETSFKNIQRHLRQRGVSLKRHYPDIYQQLCTYVEGGSNKFTPVTVYPKDSVTGKTFMCIIMPDAEPDCLSKVTTAGVRVHTVDVLRDNMELDQS